jgi:hypothetical protein
MAHFAELDDNDTVQRVVVVHNNELLDESGNEVEQKGIDFCVDLFGGKWVQTSFNATIRKNFAGVGYVYDAALDAFIPPKPYPSWLLNEDTCQWECPIEIPTDGLYDWNEELQAWENINE